MGRKGDNFYTAGENRRNILERRRKGKKRGERMTYQPYELT